VEKTNKMVVKEAHAVINYLQKKVKTSKGIHEDMVRQLLMTPLCISQ
jgi:hypothetical protein